MELLQKTVLDIIIIILLHLAKQNQNWLLNIGNIDESAMQGKIDNLYVNAEENYLYTSKISEYAELKQDLYLWVIQELKLKEWYYDTTGDYVSSATKFVVEAKKLERASLPPLNLILQSFNIGYWTSSTGSDTDNYTNMHFNFPSATENRKFTLKVGKITDNAILAKIKNNDYKGITDLLSYAKNNKAIYSKQLVTTSTGYFRSDEALFDGKSLLENKAYYFIYVEFDDENGKYYPIEGVTLGKVWFANSTNSWNLWAYTSSDFKWDDFSSTYTPSESNTSDSTIAPSILPNTGTNVIIIFSIIIAIAIIGIVFYKQYNNYKDIK